MKSSVHHVHMPPTYRRWHVGPLQIVLSCILWSIPFVSPSEDPAEELQYTKMDLDAARANGFAQGLAAAAAMVTETEEDSAAPTFGPMFEAKTNNITTMFATPFMESKLRTKGPISDGIDLVGIRDIILKHKDAEHTHEFTRRYSTRGGWHSGQVQAWEEGCSECAGPFGQLWEQIVDHVTQASILEMSGFECKRNDTDEEEQQCLQQSHKFSITLYTWANVLEPGGYNVIHTHNNEKKASPGEWSGAFYIDVGGIDNANPDSGAFEYFDPRGDKKSSLYQDSLLVVPSNGTLLLFPPYLKHMVHPYTGDQVRTTLSFNARVEMVEALQKDDPGYGEPTFGVCANCNHINDQHMPLDHNHLNHEEL